jgi:hypothetical protein
MHADPAAVPQFAPPHREPGCGQSAFQDALRFRQGGARWMGKTQDFNAGENESDAMCRLTSHHFHRRRLRQGMELFQAAEKCCGIEELIAFPRVTYVARRKYVIR